MPAATHRVRRLNWSGACADPALALGLRQCLRDQGEWALAQALDAVDDGQVRHLARLELRVALSSSGRFADELPQALAAALREAFTRPSQALPDTSMAAVAAGGWPSLRYYLAHGSVEWFAAHLDAATLASHLRDAAAEVARELLAAPPVGPGWPALRAWLPADEAAWPDALFRLLQLLPPETVASLLAHAGRGGVGPAPQVAADPPAEVSATGAVTGDTDRRRAVVRLLRQVAADPAQAGRLLAGLCERYPWSAAVDLPRIEKTVAGVANNSLDLAGQAGERSGANSDALPGPPSSQEIREISRSPGRELAPGIPLRAAGLLLLHPWLPQVFAELGWHTASAPRGAGFPPEHLAPALAFLHWLASGEDEAPDYELGGAGLLLGLAPDAVFPVGAGWLDAAAREEGSALLEAAIAHWGVLGKTSVASLRSTFLQRSGLLYRHDDGWLLRMQVEACDLLLDRLPWGIGLIRLPWAARTIHVEWGRP